MSTAPFAPGALGRAEPQGTPSAASRALCEALVSSPTWPDLGALPHSMQVYDADAHLLDAVSHFTGTGLAAGEAVVVIATASHRDQLDTRLRTQGVDVATARAREQYVLLDAAETLAQVMVDGCPEAQRFVDVVGGVIAHVGSRFPRVRAFGEMVALLWAAGNLDAALRLEALWNELAARHPFSLLCAYPLRGFARAAQAPQLLTICAAHTHVLPAESYSALASPDERLRTIVQLQQKAQALDTELAERQSLEQALRRSEQEFEDFFDQAPIGLHWVGPDGIILRVNAAELRLLGYDRDEYLGHHIAEFHADPQVLADILRRLHAGEELHDYEARMVCKDGTIKQVLIDSNVLWEQSRFIHTRCCTRDITERTQAAETRERLAAIVDSSDDAIIGHTLDGIITSWNQGAERLYGYRAAAVLGQPLSLLIPPDLSDDLPQLLARLQRGERIDHYETQRLHQDGTRLDVALTISPIRDRAGQIIGASKIARDITARKQAEAAQHFLTEASALLASSLDPTTQLEHLARLLVPTLADWCCLDLLQEDGQMHRRAVVHADPTKAALAEQLRQQYPILSPETSHTLARVLRTGQAWFDPTPTEARLRAEARDAAHGDPTPDRLGSGQPDRRRRARRHGQGGVLGQVEAAHPLDQLRRVASHGQQLQRRAVGGHGQHGAGGRAERDQPLADDRRPDLGRRARHRQRRRQGLQQRRALAGRALRVRQRAQLGVEPDVDLRLLPRLDQQPVALRLGALAVGDVLRRAEDVAATPDRHQVDVRLEDPLLTGPGPERQLEAAHGAPRPQLGGDARAPLGVGVDPQLQGGLADDLVPGVAEDPLEGRVDRDERAGREAGQRRGEGRPVEGEEERPLAGGRGHASRPPIAAARRAGRGHPFLPCRVPTAP